MGLIEGHIQDVNVPVTFTLDRDCTGEIIYVDAYIRGVGKIGTINTVVPTVEVPNPPGLVLGDSKGATVTINVNYSLIGNSGSSYVFLARTVESGVVFKSPLLIYDEDGFTVEGYQGNTIDPLSNVILKTDGPATEFLAADGNYYEINVPSQQEDDFWNETESYPIDEPKLYTYNNTTSWYASKVDNNQGNPPRIASGANEGEINTDFWELVRAEVGQTVVKYQQNTVYRQEFVLVLRNSRLYELTSVIRPYLSTNFDSELSDNDWMAIGGSGESYMLPYDSAILTEQPVLSDFAGATVNEINNFEGGPTGWLFSKLIKELLATIQSNKSASLSGVSNQTVEVGTSFSPTLTANFNQGQIKNGGASGSIAGPLVGPATSYEFRDPSGVLITFTPDNPIDNSQQASAPAYVCSTKGTFNWSVTIQHSAGTTEYFDNIDTQNPDNNLSASTVSGSIAANSGTITTRFRVWWSWGNENTTPSDSAGVRLLANTQYLGSNDTGSFSVTIPAGVEEFSYYRPTGKSDQIIDVSNLNVELSSTITPIDVADNAGTLTSYEKVTVFFGLGGRGSSTQLTINIT